MPRETKKERDIMSKNLTRKGLALGAIVALGSSAIAGTPAFAANELTVAPSAGTSYNALEGTVFNLKTTFAPGFTPSSYAQLKYQIKTDANSTVSYDLGTAALTAATTSVAVSTTTVSGSTSGASATSVNYLGLKANTASVTTSVEVTAFVDANNDGALTAGEWNTVKTVTFKKIADVTPVVTVAAASAGDTTATATVAWGDLNVEQISASSAYAVATGSTNSSLGLEIKVNSGSYAAATWSSVTGKFTKSVSALVASDVVSAQAVYATNTYVASPTSNTYSSVVLGAAATATAAARTINTTTGLVANLVKGADALATSATTVAATTGGVVRTNGSFTVSAVAKDTATTPVVKAGVAVTGSVATNATGLQAATSSLTEKSITVNGTKYTTDASLAAATFALTTDASGVASLNISSVGLADGNTITATFAAQNLTASVATTQTAAAYTVSDDNAGVIIAAAKNTATSFALSVKDQFGQYSARTNERFQVAATQSGATIANQYINVSAGKASFSVTPGTDIVTDITVTATLQVSTYTANTGVTTWASNGTQLASSFTVVTRSAAYDFSTAPAVSLVWNGSASAAYDATSNYKQLVTAAALADAAAITANAANSTWQVVTLTGSNIGEKLTVSGSDVFLSIDGAAASANSATKVAQATAVKIYVASNTVGTKTLTITNGSVSKTVDVVFYGAAATAGTKLVVTVPANEIPGRTVTVSAKLTDKFGNPVDSASNTIAITASGAGYFVGTNATETDADGVAKATFVNQSADTGTVVFTVKYTGASLAADYLTTSASTVFAQPVVVDPSAAVATVTVSAATTSQAGRALDVTVKAVDASGAAVAGAVVALSSTGAGSLSSASVVTGAAGTATVKLVAGASDLGSAVVTATSNAKSGSATVEFGATDSSVDLIGKRVYVTTEFAAGKRVTIYDNGVRRYSAIQTSDAEKVVMWNVKAGSHTIVVKISGASSDSVTFDVK
jgi:hypothetical protein